MYGAKMDEATELKLLEEMLLVGKDDGIHLDDVEVSTIDYESALQVVAAAFHSESRAFPLIANRGAPSSFKGRAAVDWMVDQFLLKKREEAVFIGQTLMDRQIVKLRPKKTLLDDLISANKDNKAKDSSRGEGEVEIGVFADADDKHYMFQKAPLMMENYIRKHLPISVAQLLKDYPPPPRAGATSPPASSSSSSSSPFLSPRARAATSFSLAAMTRSSSSRSFTELPIPSSSSPSPSSSSSFPTTSSSPSTASTSKPFIRRHGRSASVTLTGSSLTVPLKHNHNNNNNNGDSASPLASPTASPRKISKARRASLVLKEKFLIFRENRLDKSDGGLDDKEEWERGADGDGSHTHRNQHNSNNDSNSSNNNNISSSDSDSDESSSSDDSSDTNEAALPVAAAAKSSNHGSGMLSIPSARRRASMLFSPLRLGKDSSSSSSSSLAISEESNRDVVVKKVVVARRLLDENGEWSSSAADGERESTSNSSNSSSPRTSSSTTATSTSSRPGSPIMPPPSPRTQLTLDKLREAAGAKKAGVQGRLRGKSSADLVKTSNPLYGTAALDLEEMVREREERNREKHERREARRARREERRRRRAERAEAEAATGTVVKEAAHVDEGRSRGGSSEGDHPSSPSPSSTPSTSTSASPVRSTRPRSPNGGRASADRDSITFAGTVDDEDDDNDDHRAAAGSEKQRRSSDGMILTLQGQARKKANSVDKKDTRLDQEAGTGDSPPSKPARQSRLRRASSLRVSSGNLLLGRSSSDKKEKDKEKEKEKEKDKIKKTVVDGGGGGSINKKEADKRHRRKGGSFIKPRASRDEADTVVGGRQSPEQHPRAAAVRELAADVESTAADKSKRKRNLTPHSVALPLAQRMSVGVRSRSATLDVVDSSDEGEGGAAAPPASNTSPGVAKKATTTGD